MTKLIVTLSEETDRDFRDTVKRIYGDKRGGISIAAEQALKDWIAKQT